jgi:citrate synthase
LFVNIDNINQYIGAGTVLIDAKEAARRLGVKPATLYAYVSRGLLRSVPGEDSRERRYYADDVERLKRIRHAGPRAAVPPKPFDNRVPVLDTSVSLIEEGRLFYRGVEATRLAEEASLEDVAALLWGCERVEFFDVGVLRPYLGRQLARIDPSASAMDRARLILAALATRDVGALDVSAAGLERTGTRLVALLASAVIRSVPRKVPLHEGLAAGWGVQKEAADLIRRCLVLVADHELNASTYVGRCIASTNASPYAVVLGALGALSGPRHGGETSSVEALLREILRVRDVRRVIGERLERGERIPGFGHALYPNGDPRGAHIVAALARSRFRRASEPGRRIGDDIEQIINRPLNIDFALGLTSVTLRLPPGAGLGLFLVGRSVGWIAHAIEQYAADILIRPRARYVGPLPTSVTEHPR